MGQKMAYLEQALLAHPLGLGAFTVPGTLYFAASTDTFDPTLTGATITEPTDTAYHRVAVTNNSTFWAAITGSNPAGTSNLNAIIWPTASADWGVITAIFLADAATAGNLLYGTSVPGSGVPITALSALQIAAGAFVIRET